MAEKHRLRTRRFSLWLLEEEKEILERNAERFGLSQTEYIRWLILFGGITGRPVLEKAMSQQILQKLACIAEGVEAVGYNTPAALRADHPEWSKLEASYKELLDLIGQLTYTTKAGEAEWRQRVFTKLHKR